MHHFVVEIQLGFRDVLRYLWVDDDFNTSFNWKNFLKHLITYRMKVVPFGLNVSPFLLNAQASLNQTQYPEKADIHDRDMYVDDLTAGTDTEAEAIQQSQNIKSMLAEAKLPLVKWMTSSAYISKELRKLNFPMREETDENLPLTKIFGLSWNPEADTLTFNNVFTKYHCWHISAMLHGQLSQTKAKTSEPAPKASHRSLTRLRLKIEEIERRTRWTGIAAKNLGISIQKKPYVTNRIFEIRSLTSVEQWFYIPTAKNPADLLTRFERSSELLTSTLWSQVPVNAQEIQYKEDQLPDPEEEGKSQKNVVGVITKAMGFESEIERFSDFCRMLRVFAWVQCWKTRKKGEISLCELEETEHCLILQSQHHWFAMEFKSLLKNEAIPRTSKVAKYRPFQDDQGLLRLGGRLDHALITPQEKHPIFLHQSSQFTKLIILYTHLQLKHGKVSKVLFHLRKKFWILRGRRTVRTALRQCLVCQRTKLQSPDLVFASFPSERVTLANPFQHFITI
uniref:Integrase zinc-binding domain-containing protein n=1 Tax=Strigamia maritima TaxID=126957 RepID=T1IL25_STRMM